jgi:hypothetical protein
MNQTCDRCGPAVRASYRVERTGELFLCGHCASRHWSALSAQGWIIWPTGVHALAPQASAALGNSYGNWRRLRQLGIHRRHRITPSTLPVTGWDSLIVIDQAADGS